MLTHLTLPRPPFKIAVCKSIIEKNEACIQFYLVLFPWAQMPKIYKWCIDGSPVDLELEKNPTQLCTLMLD